MLSRGYCRPLLALYYRFRDCIPCILMWTSFYKPPLNYKTPPPELNGKPPSITKPSAGYQKMLSCSVLYVCKSAEREREKLQLLRPLQVCRERETAATTTASCLQRERNCSYYDRFKSAEREKLQLLRPLQGCRERETASTVLRRPTPPQ